MKRLIVWFTAALLLLPAALRAQTPEAAAAIAQKQADEERYRRLSSQVEDLQAMLTQQAKKIAELASQLASLREERSQHESKAASLEALKQLADDVQEVDKKRVADSKLFREELAKILKAVSEPVPAANPPRSRPSVEPKSIPAGDNAAKGDSKSRNLYEYVVQNNDTLIAIAAAYRAQGIKVSVDDIVKANPGLRPEALRVGQKITIPGPAN